MTDSNRDLLKLADECEAANRAYFRSTTGNMDLLHKSTEALARWRLEATPYAFRAIILENEELRKLVGNTKDALVPFANTADLDLGSMDHDTDTFVNMRENNLAPKITNGHLRYARTALLEIDDSPIFNKKV